MPRPETARLLTPPHNGAVVQLPDRAFPGVVVQGDSLQILCELAERAVSSVPPDSPVAEGGCLE